MKVLVVNDDGVGAKGIQILVEKLIPYCEQIVVVAPCCERSAASHSLTLRKGIACIRYPDMFPNVLTYGVDANPADCVLFALEVLQLDFDTVFSGVNKGYNLGDDIVYSGTIAAAREALMNGKRSIAVSCKYQSFEGMDSFPKVMEYISNSKLWNEKVTLNINIPSSPKGIKITHQAKSTYRTFYTQKEDGLYYTECDTSFPLLDEPNGDIQTVKQGYISVTPLTFNYTDQKVYQNYHES